MQHLLIMSGFALSSISKKKNFLKLVVVKNKCSYSWSRPGAWLLPFFQSDRKQLGCREVTWLLLCPSTSHCPGCRGRLYINVPNSPENQTAPCPGWPCWSERRTEAKHHMSFSGHFEVVLCLFVLNCSCGNLVVQQKYQTLSYSIRQIPKYQIAWVLTE